MGDNIHENSRKSSKEMESLSLQTPRDLLQRFMVSARRSELISGRVKVEDDGDGSDEIELNLGLSLGGRFGVDKSKLVRSSSIAGVIPIVRDDDALTPAPAVSYSSLVRTSSLPVETEEEWRKRKELQSLRRMAAKRRRSEKQKGVVRSEKEERKSEREEYVAAMKRVGSSIGPPSGLPNWAGGGGGGGGRQAAGGGGHGGSVESHGGGSGSSTSEKESRPPQGSSSTGEASSQGMPARQERSSQDATGSSSGAKTSRPPGTEMENPSKNRGKEIGVNSVEDMPCVFTKGDGPNGRRIEGILYKYGKGQEVRIMCVCHGSFLSPAEFVKHAGGTDVDHPLKHIVVNPNPTL